MCCGSIPGGTSNECQFLAHKSECVVPAGIADAYWEMRIKAWDVAAGTLLVTEAGGTITAMDGSEHSVFSRSHLASNGKLHKSMQPIMQEAIKELVDNGNDFGPWFIPDGLPFKVPGQK